MVNLEEDLKMARIVRNRAKASYSGFTVGAVLKCKNGMRYTGCNIENGGIQAICAERVAFSKAISEGEMDFERILVIGGKKDTEDFVRCLPCGYCRQFINEFVDKDFKVYTVYDNKIEEYTIEELLPYSFELNV